MFLFIVMIGGSFIGALFKPPDGQRPIKENVFLFSVDSVREDGRKREGSGIKSSRNQEIWKRKQEIESEIFLFHLLSPVLQQFFLVALTNIRKHPSHSDA